MTQNQMEALFQSTLPSTKPTQIGLTGKLTKWSIKLYPPANPYQVNLLI